MTTILPLMSLIRSKPAPVTTSAFLVPQTPLTGNRRLRQRLKKSEISLHMDWVAPLSIVGLRL